AWQPDPSARDAFSKLPRAGQCLGFSDLRPTVTQVLTFAPFILEASRAATGNNKAVLEPGLVPSAAAVNRHLFPNVVVQHDDGRTVRWASRGSGLLPGASLGIDPVLLIFTLALFNCPAPGPNGPGAESLHRARPRTGAATSSTVVSLAPWADSTSATGPGCG